MVRPRIAPGSWGEFQPYTLPNGSIEVRVNYRRLDGAFKKTSARGKTRAAAERKLKARLPDLVSDVPAQIRADEAPVLFSEVAHQWLAFEELKLPDHTKALGTHTEHVRMLRKHLLPAFGSMPVREIGSDKVFNWYMGLAATHKPLARNAKGVLSQIMNHALNLGYITGANPVASVRSLKRPKKPIFAPGVDELITLRNAVVAYMDDPERPGPRPSMLLLDTIDMILATGERISEVLGLRFGEDIHLDADVPYCVVNGAIKEKGGPKRWEPFPKTEAGRRELPLPPFAVAIIMRRMVDNKTGSQFLFHTRTGAPNGPQDVHRALRNVREYADLPDDFVPHALRKNVGTEVANNMGLEKAAGFLGHLRSRVTEHSYAKREMRAPDARDLLQAQYEAIIGGGK